jgi:hypothetical protein
VGLERLLAWAAKPRQHKQVGNQAGGRVFLFLETSDFWSDYQRMLSRGVRFIEQPRQESYGWVVVFQDLYGNRWDLVQYTAGQPAPDQAVDAEKTKEA